jgi:peptide/nickel transport system ATP-binding protein
VLEVSGLAKSFGSQVAVAGLSFSVGVGEVVGLVGANGAGKTTTLLAVGGVLRPDAGEVRIAGEDIARLAPAALKPYRRRIQMVFQDPYATLNPRRKIGRIIADGPIAQGMAPAAAEARARELMGLVGLDAAALERYPHEFSGGQRQRIGIARALALEPELLVADEPVSALDVSVQEQILELLNDIRKRLHLTMLFITHDLRVAAQVCDRIAVMRRGEIVELGPTEELFARPSHPYTRELLDAVPGKNWTAPSRAPAPVAGGGARAT